MVLAIRASDGIAKHDVFGDPVGAVGGDAHGDPTVAGAQGPVADMIDGGVGGRSGRGQAPRLDDGGAAFANGWQKDFAIPGLVMNDGWE